MGSDDLFHKRQTRDYKRSRPKKPGRERVLVVCEGETDTRYFRDFKYDLSLTSVRVQKSRYSAAIHVVNHAMELFKEDTDFDHVYCVFDHDGQESYARALDKIKHRKKFSAIVSIPCFEYWVLLHFTNSTRPFQQCDDVVMEVKKYLVGYAKNMPDLYDQLQEYRGTACRRAEQCLARMCDAGTDNPTTRMHILVNKLLGL